MAVKKINNYYIADYVSDLSSITDARLGSKCRIIETATDYICNSEGKWFDMLPDIQNVEGGGEINLSKYATKDYVQEEISKIEIPEISLEGYATEKYVQEEVARINIPEVEGIYAPLTNDVFKLFGEDPAKMTNDKSIFGICVKAAEGKTLIERMLEKGKGLYNFWVEKGAPGQPDAVVEKNSSCRGLCCLDTYYSDAGWYGWIQMFDHDGDMYVQYIRDGEPKGWKTVAFI